MTSPETQRASELQRAAELIQASQPGPAAEILSRLLAERNDDADANLLMTEALGKLGDHRRAAAHAAEASRLQPHSALAHGLQGVHLFQIGKAAEAIAAFERACGLEPANPDAWRRLGGALLGVGRAEAAVSAFEKAVALLPQAMEPRAQLATALQAAGHYGEAAAHFEQTVRQAPRQFGLRAALADAHRHNRDPAAAIEVLKTAGRDLGDSAHIQELLGYLHLVLGDLEAAGRHYRRALALDPGESSALLGLSRLPGANADGELSQKIEAKLADPALPPEQRSALHFALGRLHDQDSQYPAAMANYRAGAQLKRATLRYDPGVESRKVARLRSVFSGARKSEVASGDTKPLFIVGMPRSGTTLVEQILAQHPEVAALGELPFIENLIQNWPDRIGGGKRYPEDIFALTATELSDQGRAYLDKIGPLAKGAKTTVDKMPFNFWHLGLIAQILPGARIIHCRREAMDLCLSNFVTLFSTTGAPFSYDFEELAHYYGLYEEIMTHWRATLPLPTLDLDYESLVAEPEAEARRLLDFCGLPWNEEVLEFHRAKRPVMTASSVQARQKLYGSAVGRWRRYGADLEPLKLALEKTLGRSF